MQNVENLLTHRPNARTLADSERPTRLTERTPTAVAETEVPVEATVQVPESDEPNLAAEQARSQIKRFED